jgi:hypothetical protein
MSELKVILATPHPKMKNACDGAIEVYLKDEADKVIAEKDKELSRQKYKRCLDKAEMCQAMYDKEDTKVNGRGASWDYISPEMKYWERWQRRWLELAERFKEAK